MLPLDKWAITRLNDLLTKAYAAYDNYEFHVVSPRSTTSAWWT